MSVEALVVSALVEEGNLRKLYQEGLSAEDFEIYADEFAWIETRLDQRKPVNARVFREKFPDFEWVTSREKLTDLLDELKGERAFVSMQALFDSVDQNLEPENAIEQAQFVADMAREIARKANTASDFRMAADHKSFLQRMIALRKSREQGDLLGIPTEIPKIDYHMDGLVNGRLITVLGRPGDAKSFLVTRFGWAGMKNRCRVGMFSPEMNDFEHTCRLHTLASADPKVQKEAGISVFRNRDLMRGQGFSMKDYKKLLEYLAECGGEFILFTQKYRKERMSVNFIESKIEDLGLDMVIVDPIYELKPPRRYREDRISEISETISLLNIIGEAHNIPIVITNWSNRQGQKSDAPHQDTSYGSDAPAQKADHVIGVKHESSERKLLLRCTKSRFGGNFRVIMAFQPNIGKMEEIRDGMEDQYDNEVQDMVAKSNGKVAA